MRLWLGGFLILCCLLGGCLRSGDFTPIRYYSVDPSTITPPSVTHTWPIALGVRPLTAASRYRDRILYRLSEVEVGFYEYDRWVEPPEEMVTRVIIATVQAAGLFRQVLPADSVQLPAWILSGEVLRFDEVRTGSGSRAECWLRLELRRARDEQLVWSDQLQTAMPLTSETPEALAQAMSRAVQQMVRELINRLEKASLAAS